ncbi:M24 family metallopeptidase [Cryptosporangium minutisporangium]|uniref:Aminopeptidase P family protein n=1 Tax=Cryptosporangium minutisporangium TaxID=113569 RepID=A0ABP6SYW5_9ACTN
MTQTPYRPRRGRFSLSDGHGPTELAKDFDGRLERVAADAARAGFQGILVTVGPDLRYLCGYSPPSGADRLTVLVVSAGQPPTLVLPRRDLPAAAAMPVVEPLVIESWDDGESPYQRLIDALDPVGVYAASDSMWARHVVGIERIAPAVVIHPLTEALPMLRALKDEGEVARLAAAAAATDAAYTRILRIQFAGRTEREVAAELSEYLTAYGLSEVVAGVASGPNGADPEHEPASRPIQFGDTVVLRLGGAVEEYRSELVRTVSVGPPGIAVARAHDVLQLAARAAFDVVRPGAPSQEVERAVRRTVVDAGYAEADVRYAGHGIGLTADEPPWTVEGEMRPLNVGMCFSVEPGIQLAHGLGARLGDVVAVTRTGARRLGRTEHEVAVVY